MCWARPSVRCAGRYAVSTTSGSASAVRRRTIRSIVIARGYLDRGEITSEQLDAALDVLAMTKPAAS